MPTLNPQKKITVTLEEWFKLAREQREGESDSNFLRRKLKLKPLKQGGARESGKLAEKSEVGTIGI